MNTQFEQTARQSGQQGQPSGTEPQRFAPRMGKTLVDTHFTNLYISATSVISPPEGWFKGFDTNPKLMVRVPPEFTEEIRQLHGLLMSIDCDHDFAARFQETSFRVHPVKASNDLKWFVLRRVPSEIPRLTDPAWRFPPILVEKIMEVTRSPGLILFTGPPDAGKTVSAVATYVTALEKFGGSGFAVEDPVEFDLNGAFGDYGHSIQIDVSGVEGGYSEALKGGFRMSSQRAHVSEIRSADVASEVMKFACGAMLVDSTMHGSSGIGCVQRIISMLSSRDGEITARQLTADAISAVIYQEMHPIGNGLSAPQFKPFFIRACSDLITKDEELTIRNLIRNGNLSSLENNLRAQEAKLQNLRASRSKPTQIAQR